MTALSDFSKPTALGDGRSWTAEFESHDARLDDTYWFVTVRKLGSDDVEFFVRVPVLEGIEGTAAREAFHSRLHAAALTGRTNTDYTGSVLWEIKRRKKKG